MSIMMTEKLVLPELQVFVHHGVIDIRSRIFI
jgi:hypothetical protein